MPVGRGEGVRDGVSVVKRAALTLALSRREREFVPMPFEWRFVCREDLNKYQRRHAGESRHPESA
jgi:hypothetical protein